MSRIMVKFQSQEVEGVFSEEAAVSEHFGPFNQVCLTGDGLCLLDGEGEVIAKRLNPLSFWMAPDRCLYDEVVIFAAS
jgi:hypothetical protein